jgi:hypothetical protein
MDYLFHTTTMFLFTSSSSKNSRFEHAMIKMIQHGV